MKFISFHPKVLILIILFLGTLNLQAKSRILLVSDVDDTIKVAHVRSKSDSASNAFFNYKAFLGMSELYQRVVKKPETKIYYVSNAPSFLMHSKHTKFLTQFNFPNFQNLITRDNTNDDLFKTKTILNLVKTESPELLILIGDNGEHDPGTFLNVRKSLLNSATKVLTFVHWTYSDGDGDDRRKVERLSPDDVAFVTPIEMAIHLQLNGILTLNSFFDFSNAFIPKILAGDQSNQTRVTFPTWKTCIDYRWNHPDVAGKPENIENLKTYIENKCGRHNLIAFDK
jgi:hypothetical protein